MSGIATHTAPPEQLLMAAARGIVELERTRLPNLSGVTVLLPNLHSAGDFARALREAAAVDTLLLPRLTTLRTLAEQADTGANGLPMSRRQAMIYRVLRDKEWFRHADLWHVSAELLRLFDEITLNQVQIPSSHETFLQLLEQAYQARCSSPLQFEARLVHELWHAMSAGDDGELDDAARYQSQLAHLAATAGASLYAAGLCGLTPMERGFFDVYAQRHDLHLFHAESGAAAAPGTLNRLLQAAWADPEQDARLHRRAALSRQEGHDSPAQRRIRLYGAHSLEQEAETVAFRVGQWLAQGKNAIAVVVQDRLVARRARALLERDQVLVMDETGWTLSTTSASTVVMRWLDNLDSRFHHQDLLDLLKSPFIFTAWDPARRRRGVFLLEQLIRRHSVVAHLNRYRARALEMNEEEVVELLDTLAEAQKLLPKHKTLPLAAWLNNLRDSLDRLQISPGLQRDLAGEQLLQMLTQLQRELAHDNTPFRYGEWRQWLNQQLEAAVFRDDSIVSPVLFTHLAACRLRAFDGVIVAGADAAHLPGKGRDSVFFNQAVREQLGLPGRRAELEIEREDLVSLLTSSPETWVTWQERKNGEPNPLSPWFERLDIFHVLAYGKGLKEEMPAISYQLSAISGQRSAFGAPPAPGLPPQLVPAALSASAYNSLVACPYQFYARHALRLNELDEVALALEKREYGEYVHDILHRFHRAHPLLTGHDPALLAQDLNQICAGVFARAIEADFVSHAWKLRWEASIPGYIAWQLEREQQGWHWQEGELERTLTILLDGGRELVLRGRLDRVDRKGAEWAVLDYKTQTPTILKKKLETPGEDVQLPCYALLLGEMPQQALFVAVDEKQAKQVEPAEDLAQLADANLERLETMFEALYRGAPLPAQGTNAACEYCEMGGLCRKDYWNA